MPERATNAVEHYFIIDGPVMMNTECWCEKVIVRRRQWRVARATLAKISRSRNPLGSFSSVYTTFCCHRKATLLGTPFWYNQWLVDGRNSSSACARLCLSLSSTLLKTSKVSTPSPWHQRNHSSAKRPPQSQTSLSSH